MKDLFRKFKSVNSNNGFVTLLSVIIMFAALILIFAIISTTSIYSRVNVLTYENKKVSVGLAEACVQTALAKLANNPNYGSSLGAAGEKMTVDPSDTTKTCRVCAVSGSNPYTLITRAVYKNAYTNLSINATRGSTDFSINSWDETTNFPGGCNLP
jgi:hypothetical protein